MSDLTTDCMVKTYKDAGVDIDAEGDIIRSLASQLKHRREGIGALHDIPGFFTGLVDFGDFYLSLCTDSVGTKLLVCSALGKWDKIGVDCVAMSVNDMICVGAEPLAFVDYLAVNEYDEEVTRQIGIGLNEGAKQANVSIVGGETATLPEIVNDYDLSGTCVGYVPKDKVVTGNAISPGDAIIGLASSGIHSNGLTLARKLVAEAGMSYRDTPEGFDRSLGEELLEPTRIYVRPVLDAAREHAIKGMANITGGGLRNLIRLKKGVGFTITDPMEPQRIFRLLQELGGIEDAEMYQTYNMGMGFALICSADEAESIVNEMSQYWPAKVIGTVNDGSGVDVPQLGLRFERY